MLEKCHKAIQDRPGPLLEYRECDDVMMNIIKQTTKKWAIADRTPERCINIYDVRLDDSSPACGMNWPHGIAYTYKYLARADVRKALHVDNKYHPEAWVECRQNVGNVIHASADHTKASVTLLPSLLEAGIPVLIFAGDKDLICNYIGLERMIDSLEWAGTRGFSAADKASKYTLGSAHAGTWRASRGLTYVRVSDASHMAGVDQPLVVHDMMLRFMNVSVDAPFTGSSRVDSLVGNASRTLLAGPSRDTGHVSPAIRGTSSVGVSLWTFVIVAAVVGIVFFIRRRRRSPVLSRSPPAQSRDYAPVSRDDNVELSHFRIDDDD